MCYDENHKPVVSAWVGCLTVDQYTVAQGLGLETILWILGFEEFSVNFPGYICKPRPGTDGQSTVLQGERQPPWVDSKIVIDD